MSGKVRNKQTGEAMDKFLFLKMGYQWKLPIYMEAFTQPSSSGELRVVRILKAVKVTQLNFYSSSKIPHDTPLVRTLMLRMGSNKTVNVECNVRYL